MKMDYQPKPSVKSDSLLPMASDYSVGNFYLIICSTSNSMIKIYY
jgi:hypothetical protein